MGESRHLLRHSNASGAIRNRGVIALAFALSLFAAVLAPAGGAPRAEAATGTATIGGSIWDGGNPTVPLTHAMGAKVMVQNQHSGGAWVAYGTINGNKWTATVPAPGDYVVMFSAHGYDATSREYIVDDGDTMNKDAYLPPLPLPDANLLVYAFYDNYVNGEPDDFPEDIPLNGVEFTVRDEEGNILATGLTGSQATITQSNGTLLTSTDGLYYFTGLPPGEVIVTSDPSAAYAHTQPVDPQTGLPFGSGWTASTEFYLMTSEEGGPAWDPKLYPGDPGTEDGGFLIWHGYTEKLGQVGDPTNPTPFNPALVGTISGTLIDADAANLDPDEPFPVPGEDHPGVSLNTVVPDGFVVLYSSAETVPVHPVATTEAHPVTGEYSFVNVPPGSYKMFLSDVPIDYVWNQAQVRVAPGQDITLSPLVPRFFARAQGCVYDDSTGHPMTGLDVNIRFKSGSVKKTETTAAPFVTRNGETVCYNFDNLPEIEVLGYADVELPHGYRGVMRTETFYPGGKDPGHPNYSEVPVTFNAMNRYIQWYTANYRADFYLEPIPADTGDIGGFVWNDELHAPNWSPDGVYRPDEERTLHGVTVELYESDGVTPVYEEDGVTPVTTTSGAFDSAATVAQGWREPYTMPLDEFGGVYVGPLPGYYEFRDLAPGDYVVKVIVPDGFFPSPTNSHTVAVTVTGGDRVDRDFGLNTLVPQAGEIEGGVFDDIFVDSNPDSLLFMEKAGIPGVPVGVYDHLGYFLGSGTMGNPLCYSGSTVCPPGEEPIQKPEMERRFAPGVHIYVGNDSSLPGYNANYLPLVLPYEFSQGQFKFEADWSLVPAGFGGLGAALQGDAPVVAGNRPVVDTAATAAAVAAGEVLTIHGEEFGPVRGYGTVTLSGRQLDIVGWGDTEIRARIPADAIGGPLLVANSTGVSNGMSLTVTGSTAAVNAVYVDASSSGTEDGTSANPWSTIGEALDNLPAGNPRYVFVAPGTYYERPHIAQSDVYIIGAGPHETTVDGNVPVDVTAHQGVSEGGGPVFFIGEEAVTGPVENVMISGLTITHGSVADDIGAGIFAGLHNRGIDINNNMIVRNGGYYGGGIWFNKSVHDVTIWSNTIAENGNYGGYGGAISINDEPEDPNEVEHGQPEHIGDDADATPPPGTYEIFNNLIFHNLSADSGGGITLYEVKDRLEVFGNMVLENFAQDHGGGLFVEDSGPIRVYDNVFLRNFSPDDGGAISFEDVGDGTVAMDSVTAPFFDTGDSVHKDSIAKIWAFGITLGCNPPGNTMFCPGSGLTRAQAATFLARTLRLPPSTVDFFTDDDSSPHEGSINALAAAGITKGCNPPANDRFCPGGSLTRAQMATMLVRALSLPKSSTDGFTDDEESVHEAGINALAAAQITRGCNPPAYDWFCPDRPLSRAQMATFLARVLDDFTPQVEVFNNLFAENIADDHGENHARGGALAFDDTFDAWVYNNTIVGNIVSGSEDPAGGGIDSERNGHEYNGQDAPYIAPGYSDPVIFNNIIWDNWRLEYDQPFHSDEEDFDYTWGTNYRWSLDQLHVDNPALQEEWETANDSESLTRVSYNDIAGGYPGVGNIDTTPGFVDPAGLDWRLLASSPVIDLGLGQPVPTSDLDGLARLLPADMGAYEYLAGRKGSIRIPTGLLGAVVLPVPGSTSFS